VSTAHTTFILSDGFASHGTPELFSANCSCGWGSDDPWSDPEAAEQDAARHEGEMPEVCKFCQPSRSERYREWRESARVLQIRLGRLEFSVCIKPHRMRRRWYVKRWSM
jgi:hypothetical protein